MKLPERLASYEILKRLGAGGMAEVFLAKKQGAEGTYKLLVLKRIHPAHGSSRRFRSMFVEEAHLATRLNHPNIVQVYEFVDHGDDGLLLAMEFVDGFDVGKLMSAARQKSAKIPPWVAAFVVGEAAKGLHYAHERRDEGGAPLAIVHRDVSPQNILLSIEGVVKIADFGIASANLFREEPGTLKGKFGYMSPEQARGEKVDRRSDIYGLGVVLYEMLTLRSPYAPKGEPPQKLPDDQLLEAVRQGRFEPPSAHVKDVPPELEAIVQKAMAAKREDRFQTARDFAGAIGRALLARQELVDAAAVETVLVSLLGKGSVFPSAPPPSEAAQQTMAAVPGRRDKAGPASELPPAERRPREVRHVAVIAMRLAGLAELESELGESAYARVKDSIKKTLDHIAYKRGARWAWPAGEAELPEQVTGVVGLYANPSRAPFEAAALAVDVHEALAGASEDLPRRLRASIGVVRGIAHGERDPSGHLLDARLDGAVSELAMSIAASAPSGSTWVAGGLYRLVRRDFRWGDAPPLEVAGGADEEARQMRLYALLRPLTREERAVEMALAPNDLVGRDAERGDLHAAFHQVSTPSRPLTDPPPERGVSAAPPGLVPSSPTARGQLGSRLLIGEMGIGKTALLSSFVAELPRETRILNVECSPVKSDIPLATLCDLLREATGVGADHSLTEASAVFRGILSPLPLKQGSTERIVQRLAEVATGKQEAPVEDEAGHYRRDLLLLAVRVFLGAMALEHPLVVVLDGLQWADRSSLELVQELLRREETMPILVLLATRPDERVAPFIEGLVRIELRGLSPEEQVRLVESRLGVREGVAPMIGDLLPRVAGNPFFLLEMVDALLERGTLEIIEREGGRHELRRNERPKDGGVEPLPSTLEQLIGDRLRELPTAEHDVVDWLAVAGGPLVESTLLELMHASDDQSIGRLCARGVCDRRAGVVDFRHPLARDVAYKALDPSNKKRMHRLLGEHLAQTPLASGLSAAIVARHLARGDAGAQAGALYLEAAKAARQSNQMKLALRFYDNALSFLPEEHPERMKAHESLEALFRHLGRRRERRRHLEALRRLARRDGRARWAAVALLRTARLELDDSMLARALPVAQKASEAARLAKNPALEVEALTLLSEILRDLGDTQGAIAACDSALEVSGRGRLPPRAHAEVLRAKGVLLRYVGRVEEAVDAYVEALAVFRAVGARRSEARVLTALAFAMFVLERFEDVIALGVASVRIDSSLGGRFQTAKTLSNVGQAYARLGDLRRGLGFLERARERHERYADQDSRTDTLLCTAGILLEAGDVDGAHTLVSDARALVAVTGSLYDTVHERIMRACLHRAMNEPAVAVALASEARQVAESQGLISFHIYATAVEAAARVAAGEVHAGVLLARMALGAVEAVGNSEYGIEVRALACEALAKGGVGKHDDAHARAVAHVRRVAQHVRSAELRAAFLRRPMVLKIMRQAGVEPPSADELAPPESKAVPSSRARMPESP